jgi:hypothetical protein
VINMKRVLDILGVFSLMVSIPMFFYACYLFEKYSSEGATVSDFTHKILINNHGGFTYITAGQNNSIYTLMFVSIALFIFAMIADRYE